MLTNTVLGLAYHQGVLLRDELVEKDKYARVRLRPNRAERIELEKKFIHSSYDLEHDESADAGETGLLTLFRLKSTEAALPDFAARWDVRANAIDIDLLRPEACRKLFKGGKDGYRGHHSTDLSHGRYEIDIAIPSGLVFRGVLEFEPSALAPAKDEIRFEIKEKIRIFDPVTGEEIKLIVRQNIAPRS